MSKPGKYSAGQVVFTVIFILWFIASILGLIYFSENDNTGMVVLLFGNYLFIFGLIGIYFGGIKLKNIWILLFPTIGLVLMVSSAIFMWGSDKAILQLGELIPVLLLCLFIVVGTGLVLGTIVSDNNLKKRCTYQIIAKCVKLNSRLFRSTSRDYGSKVKRLYAPVFSYYFRNKNYEVEYDFYKRTGYPNVDDRVYIFINPDYPTEIYWPSKSTKLLLIAMGSIFIIAGAIAMYLFVSQL
ncbi:MAG: hypothetical protein GX271_03365 [Clostridiales bacterium]|jgi:hypothetical protein|nr:hypothetical protein [Clostridiales bacterium]